MSNFELGIFGYNFSLGYSKKPIEPSPRVDVQQREEKIDTTFKDQPFHVMLHTCDINSGLSQRYDISMNRRGIHFRNSTGKVYSVSFTDAGKFLGIAAATFLTSQYIKSKLS